MQLDLERMRVASDHTVRGTVTSEEALDLRLAGRWSAPPTATVDGQPARTSFDRAGVLSVQLPAGRSELVIEPSPVGVVGPKEKGGCVSARAVSHRFRVTMRTRGRGAKRLRRSRVRHVSFRLDGRRAGVDRRRPFVAKVNRKLKPGRHVLTARVLLRVPGSGKAFRRKLVYRFRVCSA